MKKIDYCVFHYPGIHLKTRDAIKLRGYFGNLFLERSPLLHNHFEDGSLRYRYPLVQYKVIDNEPFIVAIDEGAELLRKLFFEISEIVIEGVTYPVMEKFIGSDSKYIGVDDELHTYNFSTSWMALNEENFNKYKKLNHTLERTDFLKKILIGNLLSLFKSLGHHEENKIMAIVNVRGDHSNFKENRMLVFKGEFTSNVLLPSLIGIGKAVSRGFGTIKEKGIENVLDS
jgi:hypothetical protein